MSQTLEFVNPGGNLTLSEDEIVAKDLAKTHTGVGDARIDVPENDAIIPYVQRQDRVNYYVDGEAVWTGYAVGFQGDQRSGRWTLRLDGIGKRLEETRPDYDTLGGPLVYTNTALDVAIRDYWTRTPFNATVTDQSTEIVAQDEQLQSADTTSEWQTLYTPADTEPLIVQNGNLELQQTGFTQEAESGTGGSSVSDAAYSGGTALEIPTTNGNITWEFTPAYDIEATNVGFQIRDEIVGSGSNAEWYLNGEQLDTVTGSGKNLGWVNLSDGGFYSGGFDGYTGNTLEAGTTYTVELQATGDASDYHVDVIFPYDTRFNYTFDDDNGGSSGFLDGPELYPDALDVTFPTVGTAYNIQSATITSAWDDTSNQQAIAASNDNGSNFEVANNTDTATFNFTSAGRQAVARLTLSRYGSRTTATPQQGYNGQVVQEYTLTADLNSLVVIDRMELSRDHFANLKQLHDYGDFLWVIEHSDGDLGTLTVSSFHRGDESRPAPQAFRDVENIQPEVAAENYFNSVYVEGELQPDGTRPTATVKDDDAIANDSREITPGVLRDQNISTEAGARFRADALLNSALDNDELRGTISTYPEYVHPGYQYSVDFGQGSDLKTLESMNINERAGDVQASHEFVTRGALSETISNLKREGRTLGDQV